MRCFKLFVILCMTILCSATYAVDKNAALTSTPTINWQEYSTATLTKAKQSKQLIFIYAQADWCEWCKSFGKSTLADPIVIDFITNHFFPVILNIDKNKDAVVNFQITELPTILILDSNLKVIDQATGSLDSAQALTFLQTVVKENPQPAPEQILTKSANEDAIKNVSLLSESSRQLLIAKQWQFFSNNEIENGQESYGFDAKTIYISRFAMQYSAGLVQAGNQVAAKWLNNTLQNGMNLIDPVWGGMYSGSSHGDWVHPNYEKRLSVQAMMIPLYVDAYALTGKREYYSAAESMMNYMLDFLISPEGAFYHAQYAKMNAGAQDADYYKLNDSLRRNRGVPEIDKNIYTYDNGLAISALTTIYMATGNQVYLDQALKTTKWIVDNFSKSDGGFQHTNAPHSGIYLADHIQMARAFITLYAATTETQYLMRAKRVLDYINNHFRNPTSESGFIAFIPDKITNDTNYQTIAVDNTSLTRIAALIYHYTSDPKYLTMAQDALSYLVIPEVMTANAPALALIANDAVENHPLNITVIGKKDDPAALELYYAALKFPSFFITYHWYRSVEEANRESEIVFPILNKPAAFFCANGRCSLPLYNPAEFEQISQKMLAQQTAKQPVSTVSNINTIFPKYSFMRDGQQAFIDIMITHQWTWIILIFYGIGLLLAFTPCVFPLLLVLSTLLISSGGIISRERMLGLTLTYILSLASTYAVLGYLAGALGIYLQVYLQSPTAIIAISLILGLLSFSLLGAYKIRLPSSIQHYLISLNSFTGCNTYSGAALMGIILTLVASPCATAPLIGVLSIIGQIGDTLLGVVALFMMGIGMGTPLLAVWLTKTTVLPKVQEWQHGLECVLGLMILGTAIWMSSRVIPYSYVMILLSGLAISTAIFMGVFKKTTTGSFGTFWKAISIMVLIYGTCLLVGTLIGNKSPFTPLSLNQNLVQPYNPATLGIFQDINNESELKTLLATAHKQNRPVLIDFYASWCTSCIEIEKYVFTDPRVSALMLQFTLARIDLSSRDPAIMAIAKKFNVVAPPVILFFDMEGNELETRIYGDIKASEFEQTLTSVLQKE